MKKYLSLLCVLILSVLSVQTAGAALSRPAYLELNYTDMIAVLIGESPVPRITARVLNSRREPLEGQTVNVVSANGDFADVRAVRDKTDAEGYAVFEIEGRKPGMVHLTFSVKGSSVSRKIPLFITEEDNQAVRPTARLGEIFLDADSPKENSVTVPAGTLLELYCETEDAEIYYTLNGTCPCQYTAARKLYTAPIALTEDAYFRIASYKAGMEYSRRLNIRVTVEGVTAKRGDADLNGEVNAADARLTLRVSAALASFSEAQFSVADVDGSGNITAYDARKILRVSADLESF